MGPICMNVAIIGCGFIGHKRANILGNCKLVAAVDAVREKAEALAKHHPGCSTYTDWQEMLKRQDIDIVIIATLHATLAEIALGAAKAGKHVLIEKPAARRAEELTTVLVT